MHSMKILLVLCASSAMAAWPGSFEYLIQPDSNSYITFVSESEVFCGGSAGHLFRWPAGGVMEDCGATPSWISNLTVTAWSEDTHTAIGYQEYPWNPVKWEEDTGWTALKFTPTAMTPDGTIAVGSTRYTTRLVAVIATNWDPFALFEPTGMGAIPKAVSDDGRVVYGITDRTRQGIKWVNGEPTLLPELHGCGYLWIIRTSWNGQVVVGSMQLANKSRQAFRLREGKGPELLSVLPWTGSAYFTSAHQVDASGDIVAGYQFYTTNNMVLLWNAAGAVRSLSDILQSDCGVTNGIFDNLLPPLAMRINGNEVTLYGQTGWRAVFPVPRQGAPEPLWGGAMLDPRPGFSPKIAFTEVYKETGSGSIPIRKARCSFTITASMANVDLDSIGPDTAASIRFGDFAHVAALAQAPNYRPGKRKATFALTSGGTITYRWSPSTLTITAKLTGSTSHGIAAATLLGWHGPAKGWVPLQVVFGGDSGKRDAIYYSGQNRMISNHARSSHQRALNNLVLKGSAGN